MGLWEHQQGEKKKSERWPAGQTREGKRKTERQRSLSSALQGGIYTGMVTNMGPRLCQLAPAATGIYRTRDHAP